ncbi:unnamed protein product [Linum tenue]|uniref:O-fucosyltransferase family protein n=1 Tax=Linum tenue TaxID=586396 RepID=A0AAV0HY84_9ROSI|nr:unnamed protein product [Linum tenue]
MVAIARFLKVMLTVPVLDNTSYWHDQRIMESAIFSSVMPKLIPTQVRGPNPNGRNAADELLLSAVLAFAMPSANLSGLNSHIKGLAFINQIIQCYATVSVGTIIGLDKQSKEISGRRSTGDSEMQVRKETLLDLSDLSQFQNHSNAMAALDFIVAVESEIFALKFSGNMAYAAEGHRNSQVSI